MKSHISFANNILTLKFSNLVDEKEMEEIILCIEETIDKDKKTGFNMLVDFGDGVKFASNCFAMIRESIEKYGENIKRTAFLSTNNGFNTMLQVIMERNRIKGYKIFSSFKSAKEYVA